MLVIVLPAKDSETELEFSYWQGENEADDDEEDEEGSFVGAVIGIVLAIVALIATSYFCYKRLKTVKETNQIVPVGDEKQFESVA